MRFKYITGRVGLGVFNLEIQYVLKILSEVTCTTKNTCKMLINYIIFRSIYIVYICLFYININIKMSTRLYRLYKHDFKR